MLTEQEIEEARSFIHYLNKYADLLHPEDIDLRDVDGYYVARIGWDSAIGEYVLKEVMDV